jgi:hypothetical protein
LTAATRLSELKPHGHAERYRCYLSIAVRRRKPAGDRGPVFDPFGNAADAHANPGNIEESEGKARARAMTAFGPVAESHNQISRFRSDVPSVR